MNPMLNQELARQHQRELLREAAIERLLSQQDKKTSGLTKWHAALKAWIYQARNSRLGRDERQSDVPIWTHQNTSSRSSS